ncbi:MAG TPA: DnaB-like helicase C-terminal domain-containing protein, partial [Sphingomicrobium sp.]
LQRLLCSRAIVDAHKMRTGSLWRDDMQKVVKAMEELAHAQLYIDDSPGLSVSEMRAKARRLKQAQGRLDLLVVDYLQLMSGGSKRFENRTQEVSAISRGLKALAKELEVPVLALSQLSRAPESRGGDHRPQLSDLRESGSIEQDADIVLFIYRDEYYVKGQEVEMPTPDEATRNPDKVAKYEDWRKQYEDAEGRAEIIVAKQRHGSTGIVRVRFDGRITKFSDAADEERLPERRS